MKYLLIPFIVIFFCFRLEAQEPDERGYIVKTGDAAPAFEFELTNGEKVKSKKLKGSVIMLQFTASWCGVCRKEMPFIESEIWQVYKDKGLKLYGVDRDEPLEKALSLKEATGISYPLALDPGAEVFKLFAHEKSGVTRNVIIDKNGRIVFLTRLFERTEFDEMKNVIAELLAK